MIVIVIPAHNEAATIGSVVRGVNRFGLALVVDDGSTDATARLAKSAGARLLSLDANAGYERALDAGFAEADRIGAEWSVTFDADGQFSPDQLEHIVSAMNGADVKLVIGERPSTARFGEALFGAYTLLRYGVRDILCGVKAYRMDLYTVHGRFDDGRGVGTELALAALRSGAGFRTVPMPVAPRMSGRPRFGSGLRANLRLLNAMRLCIFADVKALWRR